MPGENNGIEGIEKKFKEFLFNQKGGYELSGALGILNGFLANIVGLAAPFTQIQNKSIELAKSLGLSSKSIMSSATRLIELNRSAQLSMSYGVSNEQIIDLQKTMMESVARNVRIDMAGENRPDLGNANYNSTLENLIAAEQVFGSQRVSRVVAGYDKIGKSMKSAAQVTGKLYQEAGEYGINLGKYADNFIGNLSMAQTLNFRNGVDGLKEMARKATEIRQDMQQIAKFAEKVGSVTGAVEAAAQLQVLGGSFASMANPLAMLNESLVNPEALQDRLISMTESMAHYDSTTHQIRMDAVSRQQVRRAAEAMGVDPNNLIDQAFAQARRQEIGRQMQGFGGMSEQIRNLLKNTGEIDEKTGVAGATIGDKFYSMGEIASSEALQKQLIEETRSESDDIKVIAKSVMGIEQHLTGKKEQMRNAAARNVVRPGVNGKTTNDIVMDFLVKDFTPDAIEGAANIDMYDRLTDQLAASTVKALMEPFKAFSVFNGTNVEEFAKRLADGVNNALGENELSKVLAPALSGAGEWAGNLAKSLNDFTKKYGADFFAPLQPNKNAQAPQGRNPDEPLKDLTQEQRNKATGNGTIQASSNTEEITKAAATISNTTVNLDDGSINEFIKNWQDTYLEPVIPILENLKNQVQSLKIEQSNNSIPGIVVSSVSSQGTSSSGPGTTTDESRREVTVNLNGEFKFIGDKGEITAKKIEDLLKNNPQFRDAIAHMIEASTKEIGNR